MSSPPDILVLPGGAPILVSDLIVPSQQPWVARAPASSPLSPDNQAAKKKKTRREQNNSWGEGVILKEKQYSKMNAPLSVFAQKLGLRIVLGVFLALQIFPATPSP